MIIINYGMKIICALCKKTKHSSLLSHPIKLLSDMNDIILWAKCSQRVQERASYYDGLRDHSKST